MAASKFKPGDKVIKVVEWACINPHWIGQPIHKGEIHVVRETYVSACGLPGLLFEGIVNPRSPRGQEFGYGESEFAPYNPPRERIVYVAETLRDEVTCETKRESQHN